MAPAFHRCLAIFCAIALSLRPMLAQQPSPQRDPLAVLAELPPSAEVAGGRRVHVQTADGQPQPQAVLVFVPYSNDFEAQRRAALLRHPTDEPRQVAEQSIAGTRFALDAHGSTRVPRTYGRVFAMLGDRYATDWNTDTETNDRIVLTLAPPRTGTIVFEHHDRSPAADVMFRIDGTPRQPSFTTGHDGAATVRVLAACSMELVVRPMVATRTPIAIPLPADGTPARCRLPEVAPVTANLVGPCVPGTTITWTVTADAAGTRVSPNEQSDRRAVFRHVEVGATVTVRANLHPEGRAKAEITTVRASGEEFEVPRSFEERVIALRVIDPDGTPARNRAVQFRMNWKLGGQSSSGTTTPDGWMQMPVPRPIEGDVAVALTLSEGASKTPMVAAARLEFRVATEGYQDLGDVPFTLLPIALRGIVVDTAGEPVRNQRVGTLNTDADGRFTQRCADTANGIQRLGTRGPWHFVGDDPTHLQFPYGTDDARVVVQRAVRIRYEAPELTRPPNLSCDFVVMLEPASGRGATVRSHFQFGDPPLEVPPGHWHFVVLDGRREIHRIEDLHAEGGTEVHDPRFLNFDWRAFATLVEFRIEDANGKPTPCTVKVRSSSIGSTGVCHILLPKEGCGALVEVADQRIDLGVVTTDQIVRLGSGPQVRARLTPPPQLPDGVQLHLVVGTATEGTAFDARGHAAVWLPKTGDGTLHLWLRVGDHGAGVDWVAPTIAPPPGGMELEIPWTEALQRSVDAARQRR